MGINRFAHFFNQPCMPLGKNGRLATGSEEHIALSLEAACEGMVLLKNEDNCLPLEKGKKIALFGTAQFDYVRGGGGSGDVTTAYTRNIYDGFKMLEKDGQVTVCEAVSEVFRKSVRQQKSEGAGNGAMAQPELDEKLLESAREYTDTAVLCICRYSWEGADRKSGIDDGDFYLSKSERKLKEDIMKHFDRIIVVLDVGGMVDTAWFKDEPKFKSVLMAWQAGIEGGLAIAQTVTGISNPSGKLCDTFADSFDAYPSSEHFKDSDKFVKYYEDVYVGYRYFETFDEAAKRVNYPFGFGLSYTTFDIVEKSSYLQDNRVVINVEVTNTGKVSGKEVIEVYQTSPAGKLLKPRLRLAVFEKTKLLAPGETQFISLSFDKDDMASFDDTGKVDKSAYVLEAGEYEFYVGNSVRNTRKVKYVFKQETTETVSKLSSLMTPHRLEKRLLGDGTYEELEYDDAPADEYTSIYDEWTTPVHGVLTFGMDEVRDLRHGTLATEEEKNMEKPHPSFMKVVDKKQTLDEFVAELPVEELIEMLGGQPNTGVANTYGFGNFTEHQIPNVMTADGPAGLRINEGLGVTTTAWPCASMLASTWNTELVKRVGAAGALEVKENHIGAWLTPAMNIHRNPLCGRNFEYYSEDPVLTGKIGAAMIKGIQSEKIAASMKHFCCNNKEDNRIGCDSVVSERALREIYLKGFEIAVKEAKPWIVMSSYNLVNGCYTSKNRDLLTGILREEWGFDGFVTTDWMNKVAHLPEVKAGNDLKMPIGEPFELLKAYKSGELTREEIELSVKRILNVILRFE